jgi:hypothetical protein
MKNQILWSWSLALALGLLPLAGGCSRAASAPLADSPASTNDIATTNADSADLPQPAAEAPVQVTGPEPADTTVKLSSSESPAPSNIRTSGPVGDLFKLANSGVDESVLLAFVTNSTSIFSLSPDEIIYLKNLGVRSSVVSATIQHDAALRDAAAAAASPILQTGAQPPPPPNETLSAGSPVEVVLPNQDMSASEPQVDEPVDPTFYDSLAPYGNWVQVDGYGTCWQPAVAANPGWQPYLDAGRWVYSDCGWYWLSDYSWGWAPFHYGRWFHHPSWGWCWKADRVWGPSWVCWRYTDQCCGWAPLPPGTCFVAGTGLVFHNQPVCSIAQFHLAADIFPFVPWSHFNDHHLRQVALAPEHVNHIFNKTQVAFSFTGDSHAVINNGPATRFVATATHREIKPIEIHEASFASVRSGRGELLAHDGQSVKVFRLSGSVPIRPQVQVGTSVRSQSTHAPSPVLQSASLNPSLNGQSQQFPAAPVDVRGAGQAPSSSLIIIGRKDHSVVQTPSPTPSSSEAPSFASGRQGNPEATAFSQDQQPTARPMRLPNSTSSQTPRNPASSPFSVQRQVRTETLGSAIQTPVQSQGRGISIPQEAAPAPPPRQFTAPRYDPPPRAVERVEAPQRSPQPVESRPAAPPPSAPAAPTQSSSHR